VGSCDPRSDGRTFRAVQLSGLLLAPLWLAWGLAELTWPGTARFGARLAGSALTVVGSVILATDPLAAAPFGTDWPLASAHYQQPSHYALIAVQGAAVILAMASLGVMAAQSRNGRRRPGALLGTAAAALAVLLTVAMRFPLPARPAYPLLSVAAAVAVWFGANRLDAALNRSGRARDRAAAGEPATELVGGPETDGGLRPYAAYGHGDQAGSRRPASEQARAPGDHGLRPDNAWWPPVPQSAPPLSGVGAPGLTASGLAAAPGAAAAPGGPAARAGGGPGPQPSPAGSPLGPSSPPGLATRPYGRLQIFTLLEDRVAEFDRLAEQMAEEVQTREPDTLVYVIHLVPNAPMQRIFYEIYRDRAALASHESQPYVMRFAADRRSCVLATNVIELRLKYAKVAPLPGPSRRTQVPQALEPLPPRPDRPDPYAERRQGGR
jgi:quinol monooxygenase YgiN